MLAQVGALGSQQTVAFGHREGDGNEDEEDRAGCDKEGVDSGGIVRLLKFLILLTLTNPTLAIHLPDTQSNCSPSQSGIAPGPSSLSQSLDPFSLH